MAWYGRGLKGYWKRRAYRRMDGEGVPGGRRVRNKVVLGGGRRRRIWRLRVSPRLRFLRVLSPKRFIARIRDAYVRMMLAFASSGAIGGYGGAGGDMFTGFQAPPMKEYDERMILEIYKSLMVRGQLIATSGVGGVLPSGELVVRR